MANFDFLTFWDDVDVIKRIASEHCEVTYSFDFDGGLLIEDGRPGQRSACG
jgi:hypothetical protein